MPDKEDVPQRVRLPGNRVGPGLAALRETFGHEVSGNPEAMSPEDDAREGLTDAEVKTLDGLVRQYAQTMLVRAQAAVLMKEHGRDVSSLLTRA